MARGVADPGVQARAPQSACTSTRPDGKGAA